MLTINVTFDMMLFIETKGVKMTQEQLKKLERTRRLANHDTYLRNRALQQSRHFFSSDALQAPKCMQQMWISKHNELYRKILNDPLYDARYFVVVRTRSE